MREVEVVPGEEIVIFPFEGKNKKVRITVWPERQLISAPALVEVSHMEFEQYIRAMGRAQELLNWTLITKATTAARQDIKKHRDTPGFNINA